MRRVDIFLARYCRKLGDISIAGIKYVGEKVCNASINVQAAFLQGLVLGRRQAEVRSEAGSTVLVVECDTPN